MSQFRLCLGALFCGCLFAGFLWLGIWQMARLEWKENLLARITQAQETDPQSFDLSVHLNDKHYEFQRGFLTGTWVDNQTWIMGPRNQDGALGFWLVSPFQTLSGTTILVNRGFVYDSLIEQFKDISLPNGPVTVLGSLRRPGAIGDDLSAHVNGPLVLFMERSIPAQSADIMATPVSARLRNDHFQYAIFWFAMAGLVLVMTGYAARKISLQAER